MMGRLSLLFAAMARFSDFLSGCADVGDYSLDTQLVDGAETLGTDIEADPTLLRWQPEALLVGVDLPPALGLDIGVGYRVTR